MKSDELPGDEETRDEITPRPPTPGASEHVLLTRDSPEDLNTNLQLCNDQSFPDDLVFILEYLPYYRTSHLCISPSSLAASHTGTEIEENINESQVNSKQEEKGSYSPASTEYFPYYRKYEELLGQPLTYRLNAAGKKPDDDEKDESEDVETAIPPNLESDKRSLSTVISEEPPAHQLLRERCLPTISIPSGLPGLNQTFPSHNYCTYYRTEGELCIGPALGDRFFTRIEGLENKEGEQGGEPGIWSPCAGCLVC